MYIHNKVKKKELQVQYVTYWTCNSFFSELLSSSVPYFSLIFRESLKPKDADHAHLHCWRLCRRIYTYIGIIVNTL